MNKDLKVKCPQCNREFAYYESESRPFCTEKCKLIDLGHWFKESYVVPEKGIIQDTEEEENLYEIEEDDQRHKSEYDV